MFERAAPEALTALPAGRAEVSRATAVDALTARRRLPAGLEASACRKSFIALRRRLAIDKRCLPVTIAAIGSTRLFASDTVQKRREERFLRLLSLCVVP